MSIIKIMELMDYIFKRCTVKTRLPRQQCLLLSVKLVERKKQQQQQDSSRHRDVEVFKKPISELPLNYDKNINHLN